MQAVGRRQIEALQIAEGYFGSQVLFTANELGIFDRLGESPRSAADLATEVGAPENSLQRLLNAAVAVGLLTFRDGRYANAELADAVLVSGRSGYLGNWMRLMSHWMRPWLNLKETILTGKPVDNGDLHLGTDPIYTREFTLGMDDYARLRGSEIVHHLDFDGALRLLDVGGGPGTYAILFAKRWPNLHVSIFDLPEVATIAAGNVAAAGVEEQVAIVPGNYYENDFGDGYDVVFLSDTLHQESPADCEMILRKAYRALNPGGRIVIQAMFLNDDKMSPRWPVMHSLLLLLVYGSGRAYTVTETMQLMTAAGFRGCTHRRMSLLNVNSLIFGDKPATS